MRLRLQLLPLIAAALAFAVACGSSSVADRTATPSPDAGRIVVPAPIDKLDLLVRESRPTAYAVHILSGLPSGCAQFNDARIAGRSGTTITIEVTNTMPSDKNVACTAIYGTHETTIELGTDFTAGTTYTVHVNDKELSFTAQ